LPQTTLNRVGNMVKTSSPYLESGESLILTTDRVSVRTVQYDVLLTNRYLILVDAGYTQFQTEKIPLTTIQSVKGGKTPSGELVITLFFTETASSGGSESMVLLFSQQPFEQRKRERDEWLKTLMGLIVSIRQEASYDSVTTTGPDIGIRPSKRRSISPEIPPPFTKVIESRPAQVELIIIQDEPESQDISEENPEIPGGSFPGETPETEVSPEPYGIRETPVASPELTEAPYVIQSPVSLVEENPFASPELAEAADVILSPVPVDAEIPASREVSESPDMESIPETQIIVESTSVPEEESGSWETSAWGIDSEEKTCAEEEDSGLQKTVPVSLMAAVKSLVSPSGSTGTGNALLTPQPGREAPVASPELAVSVAIPSLQKEPAPDQKTSTAGENPDACPEEAVYPDLPPSPEPLTTVSMTGSGQDTLPAEPVAPEAGNGDNLVQPHAPEATSPSPESPPPSSGQGARQKTWIAAAAILLIILGLAGVMVFYPLNPAQPGIEPTPLPTPAIQPAPQPTPVPIPPTGVWVRVDYPRSYYGWVGNAGSVRGVNGTGDQVYKIPETEGIVQVQLYKPDNSGETLTVEVYRDGKVISLRNVSTPMGSVELLVDAKTGNPPAMTPVVTPSVNETGSNVGRIMYF
jgi:hypothetical protein